MTKSKNKIFFGGYYVIIKKIEAGSEKMIEAIVYSSRCGHTYKYAYKLANSLGLPLLKIGEAKRKLKRNDNIIFISWVMENKLVNYNKLAKFHIDSVIAVGIMPPSADVLAEIKTENLIYSHLFYLRGGIKKKKWGLTKRLKLKTIENNLSFELLDSGLTKAKASALDAIINDLDFTDLATLDEIIHYYGKRTNIVC